MFRLLSLLARRVGGPLVPGTLAGQLLARQLIWAEERGRLYHYRTKDKLEVDAVIETPDGRDMAVGVKAGATVRTEDLAGLRNLASHLGDKFVARYVLYTGQQALSYGGRIKALPIDALWLLAPRPADRSRAFLQIGQRPSSGSLFARPRPAPPQAWRPQLWLDAGAGSADGQRTLPRARPSGPTVRGAGAPAPVPAPVQPHPPRTRRTGRRPDGAQTAGPPRRYPSLRRQRPQRQRPANLCRI
jgi:hypothetical protein